MKRIIVDAPNAFPCRLSLMDAQVGETVLLFGYAPIEQPTPYRFIGPVFVRLNAIPWTAEGASNTQGDWPEALGRRLLSIRAFSSENTIVKSDVIDGTHAADTIAAWLEEDGIDAVHIHTARNGCWLTTARACS